MEPRPTSPASPGSVVQAIVEELYRLDSGLRRKVDVQRARAEAAVGRLDELEREMAELRAEVGAAQAGGRSSATELMQALAVYLDGTGRAQQSLLQLARRLLDPAAVREPAAAPTAGTGTSAPPADVVPAPAPAPDAALTGPRVARAQPVDDDSWLEDLRHQLDRECAEAAEFVAALRARH